MLPPNQTNRASEAVIVHEVHRPPAPVLRYIDQVVGVPQPGLEFRYSRGALTSLDVDVVHVLESDLDLVLGTRGLDSRQRLRKILKQAWKFRGHRIALVRTVDQFDSKTSRVDQLADWVLARVTARFVTLDPSIESPDPQRTTMIPPPHYRERFVGYPRGDQVQGRMLCITPGYLPAEVRGLLVVPRVAETSGLTVRVAGHATKNLNRSIRTALALRDGTVSARLEQLSDGAQVQEIDQAELVVMPHVASMNELQRALMVLSRDRPILAPRNVITTRLAEEVGPGWLLLSDGEITAEDVDKAFVALRRPDRTDRPLLEGRDFETTHSAYAEVFRAAKER